MVNKQITNKLATTKKRNIIAFVSVVLILFSFWGIFENLAQSFLVDTSEEMLVSLGIVADIKLLMDVASGIPILGKISDSVQPVVERIFNYLSISNALVVTQIILINLCKSLLFKIIAIAFTIGLFFKKYSSVSIKGLVMVFFICPGLALYINFLQYISSEAKLDLGVSLQTQLQTTKEKFSEKKQKLEEKYTQKEAAQLEKARAKGKEHISLMQKEIDNVEKGIQKGIVISQNDLAEFEDIASYLGKKTDQLLINLIVTIVIVFLVLPILYFYCSFLLLRRFFNFDITQILS